MDITWQQWVESEGCPKLRNYEGSIEDILIDLRMQLHSFKVHSYVQNVQSKAFEDARRNIDTNELVLQIDFAENYSAVSQDEIQSVHWSHQHISIFTCCVWLKDTNCSFAVVSDNLNHDKYTVNANLMKIFEELLKEFPTIENLKTNTHFRCYASYKKIFILITASGYFLPPHTTKVGIGGLVKRFVWNEVNLRRAN
ncbi:hypothetical protein PR048_012406, partial [Dryococelus australis]